MGKVSVAFFDDHPIVRDALVAIFSKSEEFDVVASGASTADAVRAAREHSPEVIVLDLSMPGDYISAISTIVVERPKTKVIAFTAALGIEHAVRALEAGAHGYVIKGSTASELRTAIQCVLDGETFIAQNFASKVIAALRDSALRKRAAEAIRLSIREEQIVRLLLRGRTNKEIANKLAISEKTVKHYMTSLMQKLNARNRTEAAIAAQQYMASKPETSAARQYN